MSGASIVSTLTAIVVGIIVIAIVLVLLSANQRNMIVNWFMDAGRWLTTPFHNLFTPHGAKLNILFNWGLAAVVYGFLGGLLARVFPY